MLIKLVQAIPFSFAALFPVINPLGGAGILLSLTQGMSTREITKLAFQIAVYTAFLLIAVLLTGSWILSFFGITIPIVQIGGGFVVAYIAWRLLNQETNTTEADNSAATSKKNISDMAFFPLTMPITAGPGAIAVTLTIGAHGMQAPISDTLLIQTGYIIGIILAAVSVFICYGYANHLLRILGSTGSQVIMRLSAFINMCIGLEIIWHGLNGLMRQWGG